MTVRRHLKIPFAEYFGRGIVLYAENFMLFFLFSMASIVVTVIRGLFNISHSDSLIFIGGMLGPAEVCVYIFFLTALTLTVGSRSDGVSVTVPDIFQVVLHKFWRYLGGYLLFGLALMAGFLLFILPGIYCFTVFYFFIFASLFENKGVLNSFKRSDELVQGVFWNVLAAHGVVFALVLILVTPLFLGSRVMGWDRNVFSIVSNILAAAVMPVFISFYYAVYVHLKQEKDGAMGIFLRAS